MRFDRIHIPAFGPFTDLDLEFPARGGDFHVIYGANEAGKSSLLRAFRDLLFGMHGQSPDNFLHDYKRMRIQGDIVSRAGERLTFQRRKGNKNTLLDADGNPLPDNALAPFLGSVDQAYFSTMFGLGARELREGAEQLLRGEGEIGNALFSASMGGTPVQLVLAALTEESEHLFKGRSTANVSIRPAVNAFKELMRKSREAVVSSEAWEKVERELAAAEEAKAGLEAEISALTRDLEWISRCEDALPSVGRLGEEMRKLEMLPPMPDVSSDFIERARAARKAASEGAAELTRLTAQIARLKEQLASCRTSPALLAQADVLDALHQKLGVYREHKSSVADIETELAGLEVTLRAGMQSMGLTGDFSVLEALRLNSTVRLECEEAAEELQKALDERERNREKITDLKAQLTVLEAQLETLPETDLTNLQDALSAAAGATDANRTLSASESEVKRLTQEVKDRHRELTGAPDDLDATESLAVPPKASIRRAGKQMDEIERNVAAEEQKIIEERKQIDLLQAELRRLERRGELPSLQALHKARLHRDHGWSLVLAQWKGGGSKEELVAGTPLEEAFPQTIVRADAIADQLREQADAVAQAEEKRLQIEQSQKRIQEAEGETSRLRDKLSQCRSSWQAAWSPCAIVPRSPAEMEEWREAWSGFKTLLHQLRAAEEAFRHKTGQVQDARAQLASALSESAGKEFTLLLEEAKRRAQKGEQSSGQRIEVDRQLRVLRSQLEPLEQNSARLAGAVDTVTRRWKAQCRIAGLPESISPKSGLALLQERKDLLATFDRWKRLSSKSRKARDVVREYEQSVSEKATGLGAGGDTTESREAQLWKMLAKARDDQTRHEHLAGQIDEARESFDERRTTYVRAVQELETIARQAKVEKIEDIEPLLANLELQDRVQTQIATLRDTLSGLARGQTVDELLARIRAEDTETLSQRKEALQGRKQEKEAALQAVRNSLYALNAQRQELEAAGDRAADFRQHAELCAARLKQDGSRFVRLRMAVHFLQAQIERFRKENQGPLLEKSGRLFESITCGGFSGLRADFNADDTPVLVGLRPDRSAVPVGGMSDGSRDQLYLALRLAALDHYIERHEPMPLILDDLLITFDDERSGAILPQLAALARRTQIFLFTHHDHLVELCRKALDAGSFHLHRLEAGGAKAE